MGILVEFIWKGKMRTKFKKETDKRWKQKKQTHSEICRKPGSFMKFGEQ